MINLTLYVTRPSCQFCETPDEFGVKTWQLHAFSFKTGLTHSWLYSVVLGEKKRLIEIIQTVQALRFSVSNVTSRIEVPQSTADACLYSTSH